MEKTEMRDSDSLKLKYQCHNDKCLNSWTTYTKRSKEVQVCEVCFHATDSAKIMGVYEPKPQRVDSNQVIDDDETEYYRVGV